MSLPAGERRRLCVMGRLPSNSDSASRASLLDSPSLMKPTHFDQVDTECVEPGQQALQGRAVGNLAI
jgi:hypothetical protein